MIKTQMDSEAVRYLYAVDPKLRDTNVDSGFQSGGPIKNWDGLSGPKSKDGPQIRHRLVPNFCSKRGKKFSEAGETRPLTLDPADWRKHGNVRWNTENKDPVSYLSERLSDRPVCRSAEPACKFCPFSTLHSSRALIQQHMQHHLVILRTPLFLLFWQRILALSP